MDTTPSAKKQICVSRSFGTRLTEFEDILEAVSNYTASCAVKLRRQKSLATSLLVFTISNSFQDKAHHYSNSKNIVLSIPTANTPELIGHARSVLSSLYKPGLSYKKAGVIITEIQSDTPFQTQLFDPIDREKQKTLIETIDQLNRDLGSNKIRVASQGYSKKWNMKNERLSPNFTTRLSDIIDVKAEDK